MQHQEGHPPNGRFPSVELTVWKSVSGPIVAVKAEVAVRDVEVERDGSEEKAHLTIGPDTWR